VTATAATDADRRDRRRRRRATALLVVTVVALVVTVGCVGVAFVVRADTSDQQSRAEPVNRQVAKLTALELDAERRLRRVRSRGRETSTALAALLAACQAQVEGSNHAVDVANQATDAYNSAQAGLAAAFQGAGDAAVADLTQRTEAVRTAVAAARTAVAELVASGG
jgi:hypothetical protein